MNQNIIFSRAEVWECYLFAQAMRGNHNPGMIMPRKDWEIFRDDFRGKLGEVALRKFIQTTMPNAKFQNNIDFSVSPRGVWDSVDLVINNKYINVKSVKGNARFLLVETFRYDKNGNYAYRNNDNQQVRIDIYALIRVDIEPEINWLDMQYNTIEELKSSRGNRTIKATILGGISHSDFWTKKHFAPKGTPCNIKALEDACKGIPHQRVQNATQFEKTAILQQDNYIFDSRSQLTDIRILLV